MECFRLWFKWREKFRRDAMIDYLEKIYSFYKSSENFIKHFWSFFTLKASIFMLKQFINLLSPFRSSNLSTQINYRFLLLVSRCTIHRVWLRPCELVNYSSIIDFHATCAKIPFFSHLFDQSRSGHLEQFGVHLWVYFWTNSSFSGYTCTHFVSYS